MKAFSLHPYYFQPRERERLERVGPCRDERLEMGGGDVHLGNEEPCDEVREEEEEAPASEGGLPRLLHLDAPISFKDDLDLRFEVLHGCIIALSSRAVPCLAPPRRERFLL